VSWRVVADLDLCQAHRMCQSEARGVFGFDDDEDKVTVLADRPADDDRPDVERGVRYCPAMALSIEED
jgi:ferredoxin